MKTTYYTFVFILILLSGCKKDDDNSVLQLTNCTSTKFFTSLPINESDILRFIPLGNYNPPGHTFPTAHHYFDIKKGKGDIPVYAPFDGYITFVSEYTQSQASFTEYALEIAPCKEIKAKYGHISQLSTEILNQLGNIVNSETYSTGGVTYTTNNYQTSIKVSAGEQIGLVYDLPEITGIDFGMIDTRVTLPFISPARFNNYGYINAVSLLDYCTPSIKEFLYEKIKFNNGGYPLRTIPPLEGEVCYDIAGTIQGLWFNPNETTIPEDPHLALIKNNFNPLINVFSIGTSINSLNSGAYEFLPETQGNHNRAFDQISDDQIYTFSNFTNFWGQPNAENIIFLIQLVDENTLRFEKQMLTNGPPWAFSNNFTEFVR